MKEIEKKAVEAICNRFYKIVAIDLVQDQYRVLHISQEKASQTLISFDSASEWLTSFEGKGEVHPEDRERYFKFVELDRIKNRMDKGEESIVCRYRRLYKEEYRWNVLEIIKGDDYSEENPIVYAYVKEIRDDFLEQVEEWDYVTGGMNRKGFMRHGRELLDTTPDSQKLAILAFNVKGFKAINELLGTMGGDELLKELYHHFANSFLAPLLIARTEGDCFTCIINRDNLDYALLNNLCVMEYMSNRRKLRVNIRCGIFLVENKIMSLHKMCDYAKLAIRYLDERLAKNYVVFDEKMRNEYLAQAEIQGRIISALEYGELEVYYQPIFYLGTSEITGAEAFIRWNYPTGETLTPEVFLPFLESSGAITKVDYYVLQKVRELLIRRRESGKNEINISVNWSWMDFYDKKIVDLMIQMVEVEKLPVLFELSEKSYQILVEREDEGIQKIRRLRGRLFLDSFGSGDSSISMLRNYQVDFVKFDRSFIHKLETESKVKSIVHSMIDMFSHLETMVSAVGVETEGQLDFLKRQGCMFAQGNYLKVPVPGEEFEEYIDGYEIQEGSLEEKRSILFSDIIETEVLQTLQDSFSAMTGLAGIVVDENGLELTKNPKCSRLCSYIRSTSEGCEACKKCDVDGAKLAMQEGKPRFYRCHAGLYDYAAPIVSNGDYMGSFIGGQVLLGEPDVDEFREIAIKKGLDPDLYVELLKDLPILNKEQVDNILTYLHNNTNVISDLAYNKYLLDQSNDMLQDKNLELDFLANYDKLTKLSNRHHIQEYFKEYENSKKDYCVVLSDIDDFKKVNDTYGHDCGDLVLAAVANKLQQFLDGSGVPCRWGGEEFLCLIYGDREYVLNMLEDLRKDIEQNVVEYQDKKVKVTMTFGVTHCEEQPTIEKMISTADKRLYSGKRNGKNQVVWLDAVSFEMDKMMGSMMDSIMNFGPMNT